MGGQTDGWVDRWTYGGQTDVQIDEQTNEQMYGHMDKGMDGCIGKQTYEQMDGRMYR